MMGRCFFCDIIANCTECRMYGWDCDGSAPDESEDEDDEDDINQ